MPRMSLENEIREYHSLSLQIKELESKKKELGNLILQQMIEKKIAVSEFIVRRYDRISIRTTLSVARTWQATKTEEIVDKKKILDLVSQGKNIPGVAGYSYVTVSTAECPTNCLLDQGASFDE